jgi:hypothetical protein
MPIRSKISPKCGDKESDAHALGKETRAAAAAQAFQASLRKPWRSANPKERKFYARAQMTPPSIDNTH